MDKMGVSPRRVRDAFAVGPVDRQLLEAFLRYHYLTSGQVCRLLYSPGSLTYVQTLLKRLVDRGFCQRLFLPRATRHGSAPSVYALARKGLAYLERSGVATSRRYRPSEHREHSYLFLAHTLSVNDFLMACELLCRRVPEVTLETMIHERDLKRQPSYVDDKELGRISVIPDGWLDIRINGSHQVCLALELDRGTEEQRKWRRKVRGLVGWSMGPYQQAFGTSSLTVVVNATPGEKRLLDLVRWTEDELTTMRMEELADVFRFSAIDLENTPPEDVFLTPEWRRPFDRERRSLLSIAA